MSIGDYRGTPVFCSVRPGNGYAMRLFNFEVARM